LGIFYFPGFGAKLPRPTQMFIDFGTLLSNIWIYLLPLVIGAFIGLKLLFRNRKLGLLWDKIKLKIPVVGKLVRSVSIARFSRILSILSASGLPIIQSIELVATSVGNRVIEETLMDASKKVRAGESFVASLSSSKYFPPAAMGIIIAGEKSGSLDTSLRKLAKYYETQVNNSIKVLSSMIEPLILIGVGLVVGVIIIVMGMPFLQLSKMM